MITTRSGAHGAYAFQQAHASGTTGSAVNGLNQRVTHGGASISHGARGNLTSDGVRSFSYDAENRMTGASGAPGYLYYEPLGRFGHVNNGQVNVYDGSTLIGEYGGGIPYRRYVHGPGVDEPLVWYEGSGTSERRFLHADERGSMVAVSDGAGKAIAANAYDDYGVPQGPSGAGTLYGRFGYTGQAWLPEIQRYYYKNRMYWADGGRFMQTDPARDGMNWYIYPADPVNFIDPTGLELIPAGSRIPHAESSTGVASGYSGYSTRGGWTTSAATVAWGPAGNSGGLGSSTQTCTIESCDLDVDLASGVTSASLLPVLDLSISFEEELDNALTFRQIGILGELAAADHLREQGYQILTQQLYVRTSAGVRIIDIVANEPDGGRMVAYEVKANYASRSPMQLYKDHLLATEGGTVRSWFKPGFEYGSPIKLSTGQLNVICRSRILCY